MTTPTTTPEEGQTDKPVDAVLIEELLKRLLAPYEPVSDIKDANKTFTSGEIISALEKHYGVPQGDPDTFSPISGFATVSAMKSMVFVAVNTGELQLEWIMRKK